MYFIRCWCSSVCIYVCLPLCMYACVCAYKIYGVPSMSMKYILKEGVHWLGLLLLTWHKPGHSGRGIGAEEKPPSGWHVGNFVSHFPCWWLKWEGSTHGGSCHPGRGSEVAPESRLSEPWVSKLVGSVSQWPLSSSSLQEALSSCSDVSQWWARN